MDIIAFTVKALGVIAVLGVVLALWAVINGKNDLEWWHLISTQSTTDKKQYADWNKIGQGGGVLMCMWLPAVYAYSDKMEAMGLSALMGVALLYLGGVSGYAATLRARRGTTVEVREPAGEPAGPRKLTKTETPGESAA